MFERNRFVISMMASSMLLLGACSGGGPRSGEGENCTKTADCESDLKCFSFICVRDTQGVWFDLNSGLTWQILPPEDDIEWAEAKQYCMDLSLADQSDWSLPTVSQLRSLIRDCPETEIDGNCSV